jgi:membrane associated rhomboid family serine protease
VDHRLILAIGFVLVLFGAVVPWLMVLQIVKSTFALNFLGYAASISGLVLGVVGVSFYARRHKR